MRTEIARFGLPCGSFDALRAVDFAKRFPPHFHDTFAIGVVESGAVRLSTQRGEFVGRPGTILAFSPGEIHAAAALDASGYTYRMVYPSLDVMREIARRGMRIDPELPLFRFPVLEDPQLARALDDAHRPLMEGAARRDDESRFIDVMRALADRHGQSATCGAAERIGNARIVEQTRRYLGAHFTEHVQLGSVAELSGISLFHLIRVFRRVMGVPPYAYLLQLRVNRAQAMLSGGVAVADVAYACGFSDQSHLTRAFKRMVGVPPGQYGRSVRRAA